MNKIVSLLVLASFCFNKAFCIYDSVKIIDNGYEGIVIAINPNVKENPKIIESIKVCFEKNVLVIDNKIL